MTKKDKENKVKKRITQNQKKLMMKSLLNLISLLKNTHQMKLIINQIFIRKRKVSIKKNMIKIMILQFLFLKKRTQ